MAIYYDSNSNGVNNIPAQKVFNSLHNIWGDYPYSIYQVIPPKTELLDDQIEKDYIPDATIMPITIPNGFKELNVGDVICAGDQISGMGKKPFAPVKSCIGKRYKQGTTLNPQSVVIREVTDPKNIFQNSFIIGDINCDYNVYQFLVKILLEKFSIRENCNSDSPNIKCLIITKYNTPTNQFSIMPHYLDAKQIAAAYGFKVITADTFIDYFYKGKKIPKIKRILKFKLLLKQISDIFIPASELPNL